MPLTSNVRLDRSSAVARLEQQVAAALVDETIVLNMNVSNGWDRRFHPRQRRSDRCQQERSRTFRWARLNRLQRSSFSCVRRSPYDSPRHGSGPQAGRFASCEASRDSYDVLPLARAGATQPMKAAAVKAADLPTLCSKRPRQRAPMLVALG
jgi:hypothetical protein